MVSGANPLFLSRLLSRPPRRKPVRNRSEPRNVLPRLRACGREAKAVAVARAKGVPVKRGREGSLIGVAGGIGGVPVKRGRESRAPPGPASTASGNPLRPVSAEVRDVEPAASAALGAAWPVRLRARAVRSS